MSRLLNSGISSSAFFLLSMPFLQNMLNSGVLSMFDVKMGSNCNGATHFIRSVIFLILLFVVMILLNLFVYTDKKTVWYYIRYAILSTTVFYFISNAGTYEMTDMFGMGTLGKDGCPGWMGVLIHTFVFFFLHYIFISWGSDIAFMFS